MFLKISQNPQENNCARAFCIFQNMSGWLLLRSASSVLSHVRPAIFFKKTCDTVASNEIWEFFYWKFEKLFFSFLIEHPYGYAAEPLEVFNKEAVLKNLVMLTGKYLCWRLFLIKLQAFIPEAVFNTEDSNTNTKDSNTGVFLWILRNF